MDAIKSWLRTKDISAVRAAIKLRALDALLREWHRFLWGRCHRPPFRLGILGYYRHTDGWGHDDIDKIRIDKMRECEPGAENHYLEIASRGKFGMGWARNDGDVCEGAAKRRFLAYSQPLQEQPIR